MLSKILKEPGSDVVMLYLTTKVLRLFLHTKTQLLGIGRR